MDRRHRRGEIAAEEIAMGKTDSNTEIELFEKAKTSRADIERERDERLKSDAKSSTITDDDKNWILTTVWSD
jgi:hypothetical protein